MKKAKALLPVLSAALLAGWAPDLGPRAIRSERSDDSQQIARSGDEQLLLNLVRLRSNHTPLFFELGWVVTSQGREVAFSASGQLNRRFHDRKPSDPLGEGLGHDPALRGVAGAAV